MDLSGFLIKLGMSINSIRNKISCNTWEKIGEMASIQHQLREAQMVSIYIIRLQIMLRLFPQKGKLSNIIPSLIEKRQLVSWLLLIKIPFIIKVQNALS